jgi:cytochrome P450/nitrite reductase/ring-hydroxylating ferredoxin subunit
MRNVANETTGSGVPAEPGLVRVADVERLRGEGPLAVSAGGVDLVVVRTSAGLRAFEGRCPHQGALLGEGELDGGVLVCGNHGWRFDLGSGRRDGGPECLAACPVVERDGGVLVDVSAFNQGPTAVASGTRRLSDLPGPPGLPLLGNLHQIKIPRVHRILEHWAAIHGPLYTFRMGPKRMVVVSDAELAQQLLRARPSTYRRLSSLDELGSEMGLPSVVSAEGTAWRQQRRAWMEALASGRIRDLYPTVRTVVERLRRRLDGAAQRGEAIDIVGDFKRFTADIATFLAFGYDLNSLERGDDVIQRHLDTIFEVMTRRSLALIPTWRLIRMPSDRRCDRALAYIRSWVGELAAEARARFAADPARAERPANLLESLVAGRDEAGAPFPDKIILGNLVDALLAGEDTTAYTLGWAVHHLCDSPTSVAALRTEAEDILGTSIVPDDHEAVRRLAYAGAVVNETLRLRPVAPLLLPHETVTETVLGDVSLPARTPVLVLARPPACDPQHFTEPEAFRPQRWLARAHGAHKPSTYMPFGTGPRVCPGRNLAQLNAKLVLAMLYQRFEVEREGGSDQVSERFATAMAPIGLKVRLHRRR